MHGTRSRLIGMTAREIGRDKDAYDSLSREQRRAIFIDGLSPEEVFGKAPGKTKTKAPTKKSGAWKRCYTIVPRHWELRLLGAKALSTYRLAHELLYLDWRQKLQRRSDPVVVSDGVAKAVNLDRQTKRRALADLKRLGLVRIDQASGKAPRATLLHVPRGKS